MLLRNIAKRFCLLKPRSNLLVSLENENTLLVQLNRPKSLNALCDDLINELNETLTEAETDSRVRSVVLTGNQRAFAAGADIKEMAEQTYSDVYNNQMLGSWDNITTFRYFTYFIAILYFYNTFL